MRCAVDLMMFSSMEISKAFHCKGARMLRQCKWCVVAAGVAQPSGLSSCCQEDSRAVPTAQIPCYSRGQAFSPHYYPAQGPR